MGSKEIDEYLEKHKQEIAGTDNSLSFLFQGTKLIEYEGRFIPIPVKLQIFTDNKTGKPKMIREVT